MQPEVEGTAILNVLANGHGVVLVVIVVNVHLQRFLDSVGTRLVLVQDQQVLAQSYVGGSHSIKG